MFTKEENRNKDLIKKLMDDAKNKLEFIEESLGKNDYLVGNEFSVVDIAIGYSLGFGAI